MIYNTGLVLTHYTCQEQVKHGSAVCVLFVLGSGLKDLAHLGYAGLVVVEKE